MPCQCGAPDKTTIESLATCFDKMVNCYNQLAFTVSPLSKSMLLFIHFKALAITILITFSFLIADVIAVRIGITNAFGMYAHSAIYI